MNYYTSDTHFDHKNVIKYSERPFESVVEMNETMIANWNGVVSDDDDVYHLGDFAFSKNVDKFLARLNGRKHLIIGNHDSKKAMQSPLWDTVQPYLELSEGGQHLVLCHYAMRVWNRSHHGALMLYGHSHGSLPGNSQSLDVGVDCWDYTPVTLRQIQDRMQTLPKFNQEDGH